MRSRRILCHAGWLISSLAVLAVVGCENDPAGPGVLRFGQVGEVTVDLVFPLDRGEGELEQTLSWRSSGHWSFQESISFRGRTGDESALQSQGEPGTYASAYASLISQVNESQGLRLFIDELSPDLQPECGRSRSRVSVRIDDARRGESMRWVRCADGSLADLAPQGAGPDPAAGRVVQAARIIRDFTLGEDFESVYHASLPFGTLDRGEDSGADLTGPLSFLGADGTEPEGWREFWSLHIEGREEPPEVDWSDEMVIVGAVGKRHVAGDSVEIRRVLPVDQGTVVEMVERVPGDFCSPASRTQTPFHIVVAPRAPAPIRFADVRVEPVPCGI